MKKTTNTQSTKTQSTVRYNQIKLGIDVHAESYRVVRQIDGATPQPAQKFRPKDFVAWAQKQLELAKEVHSCYEAGPFGYGLHRQLIELGIHNVVVRPQNWDEFQRGVKTDKTDALALVQRLDRYVQGNKKELAVITVPNGVGAAQSHIPLDVGTGSKGSEAGSEESLFTKSSMIGMVLVVWLRLELEA